MIQQAVEKYANYRFANPNLKFNGATIASIRKPSFTFDVYCSALTDKLSTTKTASVMPMVIDYLSTNFEDLFVTPPPVKPTNYTMNQYTEISKYNTSLRLYISNGKISKAGIILFCTEMVTKYGKSKGMVDYSNYQVKFTSDTMETFVSASTIFIIIFIIIAGLSILFIIHQFLPIKIARGIINIFK